MMKGNKGITLVVLIITIAVIAIISSTIIYVSMDRFELNDLQRLLADLELLEDKVSNYYSKYERLPVITNEDNEYVEYQYTTLYFETNSQDNDLYYILDLSTMEGTSLNYGKEGYENPNESDDVYIINEASHTIYYVRGVEKGGRTYHFINKNDTSLKDLIPPSSPQINVISGLKDENGVYITKVDIEIVPGNDSWSGVSSTIYTIDAGNEQTLTSNIITIEDDGVHTIIANTIDNEGNYSDDTSLTIEINNKYVEEHEHIWDAGEITKAATCTSSGTILYTCTYKNCMVTKIEAIEALGHSYSLTSSTSATCKKEGTAQYTCDICGDINTKNLGYGDHETTITYTEATCTNNGYKKVTCTVCSKLISSTLLTNAYGHYWQLYSNETYLCPHKHEATYFCSRDGCNAEMTAVQGHWPREYRFYTDGSFGCNCGYQVYYPSGTDSDYWYALWANSEMTVYEKGNWILENLWEEKCNCGISSGNTITDPIS